MNLRELAGGDENLFNAERKLKKQQKKQEAISKKAYEREKEKKNVFEFLNDTLALSKTKDSKDSKKNKEDIKSGSNRDLNVACFKIEKDIQQVEYELSKIQENLQRHSSNSMMQKKFRMQLENKRSELNSLKEYAKSVKAEQNLRKDKKKLTVF